MRGQAGFFDLDERLKELSAKGDALERLRSVVDFELFRADLERAVPRSERAKGGRPPFDHVLMFKTLILQASHNPPHATYIRPSPSSSPSPAATVYCIGVRIEVGGCNNTASSCYGVAAEERIGIVVDAAVRSVTRNNSCIRTTAPVTHGIGRRVI